MTIINNVAGRSVVINSGNITSVSGLKNVTIIDGNIFVEGIPYEEYKKKSAHLIKLVINITGPVDSVENCDEVNINGNANSITSHNGNITCKDVLGNVQTHNGNISCGKVGGNCRTHNGNISHK